MGLPDGIHGVSQLRSAWWHSPRPNRPRPWIDRESNDSAAPVSDYMKAISARRRKFKFIGSNGCQRHPLFFPRAMQRLSGPIIPIISNSSPIPFAPDFGDSPRRQFIASNASVHHRGTQRHGAACGSACVYIQPCAHTRSEQAADYPRRNAQRLRVRLFGQVFLIQNNDQYCKPPKCSHLIPGERTHAVSPIYCGFGTDNNNKISSASPTPKCWE